MAGKPDALILEARERWKRASEAEEAQRKAMLLAKEFRAGNQWPDDIKIQRQGGQALTGQAAQPPRPCLTIDRLSQPVRQVSNSVRAANFAIDVLPNGHGADDDTADIYKGIIRRIQNQARGDAPIDWAADGAAECGLGWFRICTEHVAVPDGHTGVEIFDQDICLRRIANCLTVYCDPDAQKPTRSDARWMFVTEDLSKAEFQRRFDKSEAEMASLEEFASTGDTVKGWIDQDIVRIAEYWRIEDETTTFYELVDGSITDQKPDKDKIARTRTVKKPKVRVSTINAMEELEKAEWAGSHIPLIPVVGEELNVDGRSKLRGIIEEGMDAQRMVNYMYSAAIEAVALAPKAPLVIAEGQVEGFEAIWQNANRFNYSYLPYKPTSSGGHLVPPPARDTAEPAIQAMVLMLQKSEEAIKATTGIFDPSLGNTNPREKSGRAIMALQKQAEQGTSNYLDNVQRALVYAGELLVELIPKIYDRPGRVLQILGIDDAPQQILVNQPFLQQDGKAPQPLDPTQQQFAQGMAKFYDLGKGQYAVTVSVSKSHTTRREEGAEKLGEIIMAEPQMLQIIGDLWARDLDIPGAQEMSERLKKMLPPNLQENKDGQPSVQQMQQQLAQAQQMMDLMAKELQAKTAIIETDQIKTQGQIQIKQIQEQGEFERESARLQTEQQIKMGQLQIEMRKLEVQLEIEMAKLGSAEMMKRAELETDQLHLHSEQLQQQQELGAEQAQADMDRMAGSEENERQRQFEGEQGERDRVFQREEGAQSRVFEADQNEQQRQADEKAARMKPQNGNSR